MNAKYGCLMLRLIDYIRCNLLLVMHYSGATSNTDYKAEVNLGFKRGKQTQCSRPELCRCTFTSFERQNCCVP